MPISVRGRLAVATRTRTRLVGSLVYMAPVWCRAELIDLSAART